MTDKELAAAPLPAAGKKEYPECGLTLRPNEAGCTYALCPMRRLPTPSQPERQP